MFDLNDFTFDREVLKEKITYIEKATNVKITKSNAMDMIMKSECIGVITTGHFDCHTFSCHNCKNRVREFPNFFDNYFKDGNLDLI